MNINQRTTLAEGFKSSASEPKKAYSVDKKVILLKGEPELIISEEVNDRIKYLCSKINNVEWSGILIYSSEGDINDLDNLKLEVKDVFLMDIGSSAHTSFEYDPVVITDAFLDNPEWMENGYRIGLIHSHVNMGVFFSGTDMSELKDNAENYDFYLSLITNNHNDFTAKIAFAGEETTKSLKTFSLKNMMSGNWTVSPKEEEEKSEVIFTCDVFIETLGVERVIYVDYDKRITDIKAAKEAEAKKRTNTVFSGDYYKRPALREWGVSPYTTNQPSLFDDRFDTAMDKRAFSFSTPTVNNTYTNEELEVFLKYLLLGDSGTIEDAKRRTLDSVIADLDKKIPKNPDEIELFLTELIKFPVGSDENTPIIYLNKFYEVYSVNQNSIHLSGIVDNFGADLYEYFQEYLYSRPVMYGEYYEWLVEFDTVLFNILD